MNSHGILWIFLLFVIAMGCQSSSQNERKLIVVTNDEADAVDEISRNKIPLKDTVFYWVHQKDSIKIEIKIPDTVRGTILLLHGWNLPANEHCIKSDFCERALKEGYVLILPDFGKTTYQFINYKETRKDIRKYPTRQWMMDTFLVRMQDEFDLLLPGKRNFLHGISTGGRGAALLALELPKIFKAAASLSADFDHSKLENEPINNAYYGSIKKFPERWTGKDNIFNRAHEFESGLYVAHGRLDKVCPVSQTIDFYNKIKLVNDSLNIRINIDDKAGHNYNFWGSCSMEILQFFNEF